MSCNAKKDPNGTWRIQYRWTDWTGTKKKSQKRGFKTKKEAEEWYAHFMLQQSSDPTMTLADFWEIYKADMEKRLRKTTMKQKEYVMNDKVLPYFGKMPINEITAPMIRKWQGEMMEKGFKPTYLKTIHNQLSAILNYAVNFYDLRSNPCRKAGSMGKSKADERPYWTLEEFQKFSDAIMDKQDSWIAFQILFWTGMRIGELLALQVKDIDFAQGTITVDESLTRLDGEDLITAPKTESSVRVITIHKELQEELYTHIDAKGGLLVLKQAPTPEEIVKLGVEGIIKIWKDAKLRGNGHKKAMQILNAAMRSIGLKIGLREARMEIQDLIEDYELQTKRLERINDLIKELCQQIKYANKLLEIKGIGITTVGGFIAEVGDITRFDWSYVKKKYKLNVTNFLCSERSLTCYFYCILLDVFKILFLIFIWRQISTMTVNAHGIVKCFDVFKNQFMCMCIIKDFKPVDPFSLQKCMERFYTGVIPWICFL